MAQLTCVKVRWLPVAMVLSIGASVGIPYLVSIFKGHVGYFLPFISHAAAFPPQSALMSIFMTIGALIGITTFALRFVAVEHRRNRLDRKKVLKLNKVSLVVGIIANISMVFASHNPMGFITHDKADWILVTLIPHVIGSGCLLTAYTFYVLVQSYLTYSQRKHSAKNVFVHATLSMCIVITNWTTFLPFYAAIREIAPKVINPVTGEISLESKEFGFYYIISSLSEWAFTFFSLLFILTFYRDMKKMSVTVAIVPKMVSIDTVEAPPHSVNGGEEITKM